LKKPTEILNDFEKKISSIPDKKVRINEILEFVNIYGDTFSQKIVPLIEKGIELSREIEYEAGEIICFFNLSFFTSMTQGKIESPISYAMPDYIVMIEKLKALDSEWYSYGLNMLSYLHWFRGEYEKGFNYAFESIKASPSASLIGQGWSHFGIAVFYFDTKDFQNAKINYSKGLEIFTKADYRYGIARTSTGLASIAIIENKSEEALPLLDLSAKIYREYSQHSGLSRTLNDMGLLEKTLGNFDRSIKLLKESIELRKEINHKQGLVTSYTELGEVYLIQKNYAKALEQLEKGLVIALVVNTKQKQMRLYKLMYESYKALNNTELALLNFEKYYEIKSQLLSDEASNNIKRMQTQFAKEKSEQEAEIERLKNIELKKANDIIAQKNKDITDSINYARRIQQSQMPTEKYIERSLKKLNNS
jgi:tetratricopeptide (TPR) repeat protein